MKRNEGSLKVDGQIIAGPTKVKFRPLGGGNEGNTLPKNIIGALRLKIKKHKFLDLTVILTEENKRVLVIETSEE